MPHNPHKNRDQISLRTAGKALAAHAATALRYSVRARPAPTPSSELSPPTEMSTGGRNSEHLASACAHAGLEGPAGQTRQRLQ